MGIKLKVWVVCLGFFYVLVGTSLIDLWPDLWSLIWMWSPDSTSWRPEEYLLCVSNIPLLPAMCFAVRF